MEENTPAENIWERFKQQIGTRIDVDAPPFKNVAILFEGSNENSLMEIFEVPDGLEDGVLQLIVGRDKVTATLTWTFSHGDST